MQQVNKSLYALNKDGSYQQWDVWVDGEEVIVLFGKVDGKIQRKVTVCTPKNVGRANETTAEQQALLEAQSKWEKQYRLGYRESIEELETEEQMSPMLAHDALKRKKDISYPCYVQPKLDGLRCLVTFDESGEPVFNSRGNKTYPIQGKIIQQIKELRKETGFDVFDGEVYLHGLSLQKIVSLAKKWRNEFDIQKEMEKDLKKAKKNDPNAIIAHPYGGYSSDDLEFHIFDIPSKKPWYVEKDVDGWEESKCRFGSLCQADHIATEDDLSKLKFVFGFVAEDEESVKESIGHYMARGYEGAIIRNFKGLYEFGQRSSDLQKWKEFQETEVYVYDYEIDKNNEVLLHCRLKSGVLLKVKMRGTHQYRASCMSLVGKFITIRFQAYTDEGVPQFASGLYEREVNPETWEPLY